ncbi:MAG TPA: glycoside hydrolase family 3 C-terminal domain-containing protein, partial [bacterium]|nr:glycoside hydrolase family 3 C-terminal domain-containing protein [bacterium]
ARGVHILLGPGVNIYRAPMCGRNFEYFGEDPFLASRTAVNYIEGVQSQGVCATIKHFMGNNSEFDRHHTSSDMDERTMREIYLPTFEAAVKEAHVGAIMDSYNLVNGVHSTQNNHINNEIAKGDWGFDGLIMSDWDATYDGVAAANGGLDLEMPYAKFLTRETLIPAIKAGKVSVATLDDKVRRILRTAIRFGWLDRDQTDPSIPLYNEEGRKLALQTAEEGMVLLKNQDILLPLVKGGIRTLAVIGPDAYPAVPTGGGSAKTTPFVSVSPLEGLTTFLSGSATVLYKRGLSPLNEIYPTTRFSTLPKGGQNGLQGEYFNNPDFSGEPVKRVDAHLFYNWDSPNQWPAGDSHDTSARWSGYFIPAQSGAYRLAAQDYGLDEYRVYFDGKLVLNRKTQDQPVGLKTLNLQAGKAYAVKIEYVHRDHHSWLGFGVFPESQFLDPEAKKIAAKADAVVLCVGFDPSNESEGFDRTFALPVGQDELIEQTLKANHNTVVVITSGGAVDMTKWVNQAPAILEDWYPGQEGGTALAEILFGQVNPSGKLPASFEKRWEDNAVHDSYYPDADNHIKYKEGVFLGYRHFDQDKVKPLFPFGFGLSYTQFKYANLALSSDTTDGEAPVTVSFDVTNTGEREGKEVAELYVGDSHSSVKRPVKELKGFAKVDLNPGETKHVEIAVNKRALSYWDGKGGAWKAEPGDFDILVGPSSEQIDLRGKIKLLSLRGMRPE